MWFSILISSSCEITSHETLFALIKKQMENLFKKIHIKRLLYEWIIQFFKAKLK